MYHFAPMGLYALFAIGVACYAISVSRSMSGRSSSRISCFVGWLILLLFYVSWAPLLLHYVVILFWLPPTIFVDLNNVLSNPNDLNEISQYIAYYIHIVAIALFFLWIHFLLKIRRGEQGESSERN